MMTRLMPFASQVFDGRHGADAAASWIGITTVSRDAVDRGRIARRAGEGAVEVDDVEYSKPCVSNA